MTDTKNTVSNERLAELASTYKTVPFRNDDDDDIYLALTELQSLRASIPGGVGVKGLADAKKRMQEALDLHDAEVADQLASEGERADLWTDIDVLVDDLRVILSALDLSPEEEIGR